MQLGSSGDSPCSRCDGSGRVPEGSQDSDFPWSTSVFDICQDDEQTESEDESQKDDEAQAGEDQDKHETCKDQKQAMEKDRDRKKGNGNKG